MDDLRVPPSIETSICENDLPFDYATRVCLNIYPKSVFFHRFPYAVASVVHFPSLSILWYAEASYRMVGKIYIFHICTYLHTVRVYLYPINIEIQPGFSAGMEGDRQGQHNMQSDRGKCNLGRSALASAVAAGGNLGAWGKQPQPQHLRWCPQEGP